MYLKHDHSRMVEVVVNFELRKVHNRLNRLSSGLDIRLKELQAEDPWSKINKNTDIYWTK